MIVKCQQQNIFKIRDKIPGHGFQEVLFRYYSDGNEYIQLACGCTIPISWLLEKEQQAVLLNTPRGKKKKLSTKVEIDWEKLISLALKYKIISKSDAEIILGEYND